MSPDEIKANLHARWKVVIRNAKRAESFRVRSRFAEMASTLADLHVQVALCARDANELREFGFHPPKKLRRGTLPCH